MIDAAEREKLLRWLDEHEPTVDDLQQLLALRANGALERPRERLKELNSLVDEGAHRMADLLMEHSSDERKRRPFLIMCQDWVDAARAAIKQAVAERVASTEVVEKKAEG